VNVLMPRASGGGRDPRSFCGRAFPWPVVRELADGQEITACYLVHEKQRKVAGSGKPYLQLLLGDATGTVPAMVWDDAERFDALFGAEDVVGIRARVGSYKERPQLTIQSIEALTVADEELAHWVPSSPRDRAEMERELDLLVRSVGDEGLRLLLQRCVGRQSLLGRQFRLHPAAKRNHHAYLGGLLEHSISVAAACHRLCAHYLAQGARLDRDITVTAALLHDIGKVRELSSGRTFAYTDEGHLLGHILIGLQIVVREAESVPQIGPDRLLHLQHLIASHQGRLEWASPKVPQTMEALILHAADELDAKMNSAIHLLSGVDGGGWSGYDRHLERSLYQPPVFPPDVPVEPVPPAEVVEVVLDMFRGA
jgi:3'-5' exoribonuclease